MKPLNAMILICVFLTGIAATGCGGGNNDSNTSSDIKENVEETGPASNSCAADGDCVPDECCHAKACVAKANGPKNCADMMCSQECREGTMDCGAGQCACMDGTCAVKWKE